MTLTLTDRQREVLSFIALEIASNGTPPTRYEICRHFGFSSPNAAAHQLRQLERAGAIELVPKVSRGIRLVSSLTDADRQFINWYSGLTAARRLVVRAAVAKLPAEEPDDYFGMGPLVDDRSEVA